MKPETRLERYDFSEAEIDQLGRDLGQQVARLGLLRQQKKDESKDLKALIDACEENCAKLSSCITTGFEMREVPAQRTLAAVFAEDERRRGAKP